MGKFRSGKLTLRVIGYLILALGPLLLFSLLSSFLLHVHNENIVDLYIIFNCNWDNLVQTIKGIGTIIIVIDLLALINLTEIWTKFYESY